MSELLPTMGMYTILSLATGLKIAVYLSVLTLAFLVDAVSKKTKSVHGLNLMAIFFIVIAVLEFFHVMAHVYGILPWLASHETLKYMTNSLFILGGLSLIWYLWEINKNIKDYK